MARMELHRGAVVVTLSRRNVLALWHKVGWEASKKTITVGDCYRDGQPVDDVLLVLQVEDDDVHYARRLEPPGEMHPATEEFIAGMGGDDAS